MPSSSDLLTEFTDFVQFFVWLVVSYSQQKLFLTLVSKPMTCQSWRRRDLNTLCFESWELEAILSPYSNQMLRNEWPLRTPKSLTTSAEVSQPQETKPGKRDSESCNLAGFRILTLQIWNCRHFKSESDSSQNTFFEIMELGGTYKCPFQLWLFFI